jgi:hypothetical protein
MGKNREGSDTEFSKILMIIQDFLLPKRNW